MSYKWYWMSDSGWLVYDAKKSADLEKGFNAKSKSVSLDKVWNINILRNIKLMVLLK